MVKPRVQSTLELFFWATCKAPGIFLGIMLNLGWDKKPGRLSDGFNNYIHIIEKNGEKNSRQLVPFFSPSRSIKMLTVLWISHT